MTQETIKILYCIFALSIAEVMLGASSIERPASGVHRWPNEMNVDLESEDYRRSAPSEATPKEYAKSRIVSTSQLSQPPVIPSRKKPEETSVVKQSASPSSLLTVPKSNIATSRTSYRDLDLKTAQNQQPPNSMQASSDDADNDADELSQDHPANDAEVRVPAMNSVLKVEDIVEQGERYQYSGYDKPDPFLAPIQLVEAKKQVLDSEEIPIISPLQYFDVKALQTKGVWEAEAGNWKAMIETPDQQGIITKLGDPIGNSGGRVIQVSTNGVLVREYKLQKDGTQAFSERLVPMAKDSNVEDQFLGGKIILTPGGSTPIVEKPEDPTSLILQGKKSSQNGGDTLKESDRLLIEEWIKKSEIASKKDNEGQQRDSREDAAELKAKDVQVSPAFLDTSKAGEGISNSGGGTK